MKKEKEMPANKIEGNHEYNRCKNRQQNKALIYNYIQNKKNSKYTEINVTARDMDMYPFGNTWFTVT